MSILAIKRQIAAMRIIKPSDINDIYVDLPCPLTLATRRLFNYVLRALLSGSPKNLACELAFDALAGVFAISTPRADQLLLAGRVLQRSLLVLDQSSLITTLPMLASLTVAESQQSVRFSFSKQSLVIYQEPLLLESCLMQLHFVCKYSAKLYNLLAPYYFQDSQQECCISLVKLRDLLGVDAEKLVNFADFLRFVLRPAVTEINDYASFAIEVEPVRSGRKIAEVKFIITAVREFVAITNSLQVIPPKRPPLRFNEKARALYAEILNAPIKKRMDYFKRAVESAKQQGKVLPRNLLDLPDAWLRYLVEES